MISKQFYVFRVRPNSFEFRLDDPDLNSKFELFQRIRTCETISPDIHEPSIERFGLMIKKKNHDC